MIISNLSYVEDIYEVASIVGGDCSIKYSEVNGKVSVKSEGAPLQKIKNKDGSITYTCQKGNSFASVNVQPSSTADLAAVASSIISWDWW